MVEACVDLKDLAELAFVVPIDHCLHSRIEGELTGAANKRAGSFSVSLHNSIVSLLINTEGLFTKKSLAALDDINIELFVKVVRNSAVDSVNIFFVKKFFVI